MTPLSMSQNATGIESRMDKTVSVEANVGANGHLADDEGMVSPVWLEVQGLGAVPCLIYEHQPRRVPGQEMTEDLTMATILFAKSPVLPRDQVLRFATLDSASGKTIHYYAEGKVNSPAGAYQRVMARLGAIA